MTCFVCSFSYFKMSRSARNLFNVEPTRVHYRGGGVWFVATLSNLIEMPHERNASVIAMRQRSLRERG